MIPTISPRLGIRAFAGFTAVFCPLISAQDLSSLRDYSVIVSGNFSTNSDVYGRTAVGKNLTVTNSANFATGLKGKVSPAAITLQVGGSLNAGNPLQIEAGSFALAGSKNGRIVNFNGGGSLIMNPEEDFSGIYNNLAAASTSLRNLTTNSSIIQPGSQPSALVFVAQPDENGLAVFNISGSDLFGNSKVQQIDLTKNGATDLVFNVSGLSLTFNYGNFTGLFNDPLILEKVIWNFYEAESLDLKAKSIGGLILAPLADVKAGTVVRGPVVAENFVTTGKVDLPGYAGIFANASPAPIPEPSALAFCAGGAGLLLIRRRRGILRIKQ